jgi:pyridinium-3,5-biscarboxylic acid mononucleotide synthase
MVPPGASSMALAHATFITIMQNPLNKTLKDLQNKKITVEEAISHIQQCGAFNQDLNLGYAVLDIHRAERSGTPEVVFAAGKTAAQTVEIVLAILSRHPFALVTRCGPEHVALLSKLEDRWPVLVGKRAGVVLVGTPPSADAPVEAHLDALSGASAKSIKKTVKRGKKGKVVAAHKPRRVVAIVTAGTSDEAVAEEAMMTCQALGQATVRINDVGVAGLHRLINRLPELRAASVIICIAGMEGALPSVLGGLVKCPVIAVPTSVGYGASFSGLAALLGMLTSCAPGVTVVNIDNGFGAAVAACRILAAGAGE